MERLCQQNLTWSEQLEQKRAYWKRHIDSWRKTGLSQAEYCRRHNLKVHQMIYWKKRYVKTETQVSFAGVNLEGLLDLGPIPKSSSLSLVINDRFKIEVCPGFDAQLLRQLILALDGLE